MSKETKIGSEIIKKATEMFQKLAASIDMEKLKALLANRTVLTLLAQRVRVLREYGSDIRDLLGLIKAYVCDGYRDVRWQTIAWAAAALLYILSPLDIVVDATPVIGYLDDVAVLMFCLKRIRGDLNRYRVWKMCQRKSERVIAVTVD